MELLIPAEGEYALAVGLAVDGLGMRAGLDMDMLSDLRTLCTECIDALIHQPFQPARIRVNLTLQDTRLRLIFSAEDRRECSAPEANCSPELTRGILETLMPEVLLDLDPQGIRSILCSMPV